LADAGIELMTNRRATAVESDSITFDDGTRLPADVPITIPIHRLQPVVRDSGLAAGAPFIRVDRHTLETGVAGVFAIGDTNAIPLGEKAGIPKAGVFAAGQGRHVARVIAHREGIGEDPGTYDGVGHCFLMFGRHSGAEVGGDFYAEGGPDVGLGEASPEGRTAKSDWERAWARFEV
jgi:sulfide:quinone oxidoreductase